MNGYDRLLSLVGLDVGCAFRSPGCCRSSTERQQRDDWVYGGEMKIRGRHERDYFEAAIEVAPPALQAIAAVAITFALTFAGHHFVPDWSVALTLVVGVITLVAASLW